MPKKCETCRLGVAVYGYTEKIPICCRLCRLPDMKNVTNRKCEKCNKIPSYNLIGQKPLFCVTHKTDEMVDVSSKKCEHKTCERYASYNYKSLPKKYCFEHKEKDMVHVYKVCLECNKYAFYNYENMKAKYCNQHKKDDMVYCLKTCLDCHKIPSYNYSTETNPIYCNEHKQDNMVDIKNKFCINNCGIQVNDNTKQKGYCTKCFFQLFPNEKRTIHLRVKEFNVSDFLKTHIPDAKFIFDKRCNRICKKRPDILLNTGTHNLIIEVDEFCHSKYKKETEIVRYNEIYQALGEKKCVFIRFNTDSYKDGGNITKSPWKNIKGTGLCVANDEEWNKRLLHLKERVLYWIINVPDSEIHKEFLFY